jgi:hypothetical protein
MYRNFNEEPTRPYRALQVWQILISKASNRQLTTYKELQNIIEYGGAGVFAQILGHIMNYCEKNSLPPLTVLVTNSRTGAPGDGLTTTQDVDASREVVFNFSWFQVIPPTPAELAAAFNSAPHVNQP